MGKSFHVDDLHLFCERALPTLPSPQQQQPDRRDVRSSLLFELLVDGFTSESFLVGDTPGPSGTRHTEIIHVVEGALFAWAGLHNQVDDELVRNSTRIEDDGFQFVFPILK